MYVKLICQDGVGLKAHNNATSISALAFFFRTPFLTTFHWGFFLKPTGIDLIGAQRADFRQKLKIDE